MAFFMQRPVIARVINHLHLLFRNNNSVRTIEDTYLHDSMQSVPYQFESYQIFVLNENVLSAFPPPPPPHTQIMEVGNNTDQILNIQFPLDNRVRVYRMT